MAKSGIQVNRGIFLPLEICEWHCLVQRVRRRPGKNGSWSCIQKLVVGPRINTKESGVALNNLAVRQPISLGNAVLEEVDEYNFRIFACITRTSRQTSIGDWCLTSLC